MSATALGMIILAYLCGSISSAIVVCRVAGLPDPRENGSGNPGATNVLRIGGKTAAAAVLIFDVLKGMLPVWLAYKFDVAPLYLGLTAIAACLGHIYPVFFHFRGGKGVATAFGAIAPIGWDLTGLMTVTWLLTVLLSGYSSLGAIVSALVAPFYVWWFTPQLTFPVAMLSCLILMRHHDNIQRLCADKKAKSGRNSKSQQKKPTRLLKTRLLRKSIPTNSKMATYRSPFSDSHIASYQRYTAGSSAKGQRGRTETLRSAFTPLFSRTIPAYAIIAPLSVQNSGRA